MLNPKKKLSNLLLFKEPAKIEEFVLQETEAEQNTSIESSNSTGQSSSTASSNAQKDIPNTANYNLKINSVLSENLKFMKNIYNVPLNSDVVIREFAITLMDQKVNAFIMFFDGMTDRKLIDDNILNPLMLLSNLNTQCKPIDIASLIKDSLLPHNQIIEVNEYSRLISDVNYGGCALFIEGVEVAFSADVKGFEYRSVEKPSNELVIRGPQEGFTETLRVNTALVRKRLKDQNLIIENIEVGEKSKTPCALLYIKDIVNDTLVEEVRKRITSIKVDYLGSSGELEQLIEDNTFLPAPQLHSTERPDRIAAMLQEGRVALIVDGTPYALAAPVTYFDLLHSPEDYYSRFPIGNLFRAVRLLGIFTSLLLPGFYIAITTFHQEMIPTSLLLAIEASREKVPFPSLVEILLMEIAFELIREAGIRIPGPIGPTLGIIGALILGQAAVSANIVSPILIIIVAVTGIGSFSMPNFSLALYFRMLRFAFIIIAGISGFLGISVGFFIYGTYLCSAKSFGVPFLAPYAPKTKGDSKDETFMSPLWKQEARPDYLNTKRRQKQPYISQLWKNTKNKAK